jgi:hypothetical protein
MVMQHMLQPFTTSFYRSFLHITKDRILSVITYQWPYTAMMIPDILVSNYYDAGAAC